MKSRLKLYTTQSQIQTLLQQDKLIELAIFHAVFERHETVNVLDKLDHALHGGVHFGDVLGKKDTFVLVCQTSATNWKSSLEKATMT